MTTENTNEHSTDASKMRHSSLRLPDDLYNQLEQAAEEDSRRFDVAITVSALVRKFVREGLRKRQREARKR